MKKDEFIAIQNQVITITKSLNFLEKISWPKEVENRFFSELARGNKPVLNFSYQKFDFSQQISTLLSLKSRLSKSCPLENYTIMTIDSYISLMEMIQQAGNKTFQDFSIKEYGHPKHKLFGSHFSHLEMARNILSSFKEFEHPYLSEDLETYTATNLRKMMKKESMKIFGEDSPEFYLDGKMIAKASAGRSKVRLRKKAEFTRYDFRQLLIHELMTHSLTAINGSKQTYLPLFAQGSPRTTKTQEGLATFSEIITGVMDLPRLKRLLLRVVAIDMAMDGADFYDLYSYFHDHGQDQKESYLSASRIFRGGSPDGGIVFTKDGVYLEGLLRVHSFFRWAFKNDQLGLTHLLFCGRLDINDVFMLKDEYLCGRIQAPAYLPQWYRDVDLFAGKMAFSLILNNIELEKVSDYFQDKLDQAA